MFLFLLCLIKADTLLSHLLAGFLIEIQKDPGAVPLSLLCPSAEQTHTHNSLFISTLISSDSTEGEALAFFLPLLSKSSLACKSSLPRSGNICDI